MFERIVKRAVDLVGAFFGLLVSLPIILLAGVAIKLESQGPGIFVQKRAGENGKPFRMAKLRTMVVGTDIELARENTQVDSGVKAPEDPRITNVGRFLRRWSLDEFPQLWNVLKGEMSLVGPRPEETWIVAQYDDRHRHRLVMKPGITGPMQISGRANLDMEQRLDLEVDYVVSYSIRKDFEILIKTLPAIIRGEGAH